MPGLEPFPIKDKNVSHVILEVFGGDNNLSRFVLEDLQEMAAGNTGNFATLALTDFADKPAQVVELSPRTGHRVVAELGEIDTGDPETLAGFLGRALATYPEARKAIGFWDHGSGVFDEYDPEEKALGRGLRRVARRSRSRSYPARRLFVSRARLVAEPRLRAMLHDDTNGGLLTNHEAYGVLRAAFDAADRRERVDLVFSDTCLNGMIEVLAQVEEFADVVVASEDLEPGDGWDYKQFLQKMSAAPPPDAATWGRQAVEAFEHGYRDREDQHPCTLGAFQTGTDLVPAFKGLVDALKPHGKQGFTWAQEARTYTQAFARRDTYDIQDFAARLRETATAAAVQGACDAIVESFAKARVHSTALGPTVARSHGLAFWFPSSRYAFQEVEATYRKLLFDQAVGWSAYLGASFGL